MNSLAAAIDPQQRRLFVVDTADYLGVSVATLDRWRRKSRGPAYVRVGGSIRYILADLDSWLASMRVEPKTEQARSDDQIAPK